MMQLNRLSAVPSIALLCIMYTPTVMGRVLWKRDWYQVRAAIQMSVGTYFDGSFDPSYIDAPIHSYDLVQSGGETAVIAYVEGSQDGPRH